MRVKEIIQILKYDCFHVTLKITPLLASKVALFYDTSLLIQCMLILSVLLLLDSFMWKMRVTQKWWFKFTKLGLSWVLPWVLWNPKFSSKTDNVIYIYAIYALLCKKCQISKFKKRHEFLIMILNLRISGERIKTSTTVKYLGVL